MLLSAYALSGTDPTYAATRLSSSATDCSRGAEPSFADTRYALSGTGLAYGASCLRAGYAMSSTGLAYGNALPSTHLTSARYMT
eukprot:1385247-Rhodomonas_salina.1